MLEVAEIIENAKPESFHMGAWFGEHIEAQDSERWDEIEEIFEHDDLVVAPVNNFYLNQIIPLEANKLKISCGTTACVAGWAVANEYFKNSNKDTSTEDYAMRMYYEGLELHQINDCAIRILDLTPEEASRLFFVSEESIWADVAENYSYGKNIDYDFQEAWNISNKEAADILRKIANGEYKLYNEDEEED